MTIAVVSCGLNAPTKQRCLDSVARQTVCAAHVYVEAGGQAPPRPLAQNLDEAIRALPPETVIAWLDGDDWFAHDRVIERVASMYEDPECWLTYGSYVCADGRAGICRVLTSDDFRGGPWIYSHLKTFRAGLFHSVERRDLQRDGEWISLAVDQAVMFPMLEMCGAERVRFCPEILAVYNYASSFEHRASGAGLADESRSSQYIRSLPRYRRLQERPW